MKQYCVRTYFNTYVVVYMYGLTLGSNLRYVYFCILEYDLSFVFSVGQWPHQQKLTCDSFKTVHTVNFCLEMAHAKHVSRKNYFAP